MNCADCKFCMFIDEGYSNYTVENTVFECAREKHPDGTFDRFYGTDPRLEYANQCEAFEAGECIEMDVDHENLDDLTPEQLEVWKQAGN